MIVLAIVAVLLTLTGGLLQRNIAQQERIVELERITQLFNKLSYKAYYGGGPYVIRFQESTIYINSSTPSIEEQALDNQSIDGPQEIFFEQLTFVPQDYKVSSKGVISPNHFSIIERDVIKEFSFKTIFDDATEE